MSFSNLIILDEAHNLINTILSTHTVVVTSISIAQARQALKAYLDRFKSRLKGSSAMYLKQFVGVVDALDHFCGEWAKSDAKEEITTASEVVRSLRGSLDQVNFLKLDRYLKEGKIAFKVRAFGGHTLVDQRFLHPDPQQVSGYAQNVREKEHQKGKDGDKGGRVRLRLWAAGPSALNHKARLVYRSASHFPFRHCSIHPPNTGISIGPGQRRRRRSRIDFVRPIYTAPFGHAEIPVIEPCRAFPRGCR
jgi:hypothetical protein